MKQIKNKIINIGMTFKEYLTEMPHFGANPEVTLKCPYKYHHGGLIDSAIDKWTFDFGAEDAKDKDQHDFVDYMKNRIDMRTTPNGVIPMYCKSDEKVFMYDFDTKKAWAPTTPKELEMCRLLIKGMLHPSNHQTHFKPKIIRTDEVDNT